MPRKSSSALTVFPTVDVRSTRLEPRDKAPAEIKDVFRELTMAVRPQHFRPGEGDLIEQYAQAIILARQAFAELERAGSVTADGRTSPWLIALEKAHRSASALAARLRLCPQSRVSARAAGRQKPPPARPRIWEDF